MPRFVQHAGPPLKPPWNTPRIACMSTGQYLRKNTFHVTVKASSGNCFQSEVGGTSICLSSKMLHRRTSFDLNLPHQFCSERYPISWGSMIVTLFIHGRVDLVWTMSTKAQLKSSFVCWTFTRPLGMDHFTPLTLSMHFTSFNINYFFLPGHHHWLVSLSQIPVVLFDPLKYYCPSLYDKPQRWLLITNTNILPQRHFLMSTIAIRQPSKLLLLFFY